MAGYDPLLLYAFTKVVWLYARDSEPPVTVTEVLETILKGQYTVLTNGVVMLGTSDEGQSGSFQLPPGLDPASIMIMASLALDFFSSQPDPENPVFENPYRKRLQMGFQRCPPT